MNTEDIYSEHQEPIPEDYEGAEEARGKLAQTIFNAIRREFEVNHMNLRYNLNDLNISRVKGRIIDGEGKEYSFGLFIHTGEVNESK